MLIPNVQYTIVPNYSQGATENPSIEMSHECPPRFAQKHEQQFTDHNWYALTH